MDDRIGRRGGLVEREADSEQLVPTRARRRGRQRPLAAGDDVDIVARGDLRSLLDGRVGMLLTRGDRDGEGDRIFRLCFVESRGPPPERQFPTATPQQARGVEGVRVAGVDQHVAGGRDGCSTADLHLRPGGGIEIGHGDPRAERETLGLRLRVRRQHHAAIHGTDVGIADEHLRRGVGILVAKEEPEIRQEVHHRGTEALQRTEPVVAILHFLAQAAVDRQFRLLEQQVVVGRGGGDDVAALNHDAIPNQHLGVDVRRPVGDGKHLIPSLEPDVAPEAEEAVDLHRDVAADRE